MTSFASVVDNLRHWAHTRPDHPAFIFRDCHGGRRVLTFEFIYRLGGSLAAQLRASGLGRGHFILNVLPNCPERVICEAGILMSGAASVNGQCQLADGSDVMRVLHHSKSAAIILDPDVSEIPWKSLRAHLELTDEGDVISDKLPNLKKAFFVRRRSEESDGDFLRHLEALDDCFHAEEVSPDDICTVFTTSGSTGFSKLVAYDHAFVLGTRRAGGSRRENVDPNRKDFSLALLGWSVGYAGLTFVSGVTRVLCDVRAGVPDDMADFIIKAFQEEKCSAGFLPPVHLMQVFERLKQLGKQTFKETKEEPCFWDWKPNSIMVGGQPITRAIVQAANLLTSSVVVVYGGTDFGVVAMLKVADAAAYKDLDCGFVLPGVEVRIVSPNNEGESLSAGQTGNILVKRRDVLREYLNDNEATEAAFTSGGFFRTGDVGRLTSDAHLFVEGRGSDAIMRGVYIFYPGWLEARIRNCPGVLDVVVVGIPNPVVNEEICACLLLESDDVTVDHVREFVEKDILASNDDPLSPRPRHYMKFTSFPQSATGKTHRKSLKELAAKHLLS